MNDGLATAATRCVLGELPLFAGDDQAALGVLAEGAKSVQRLNPFAANPRAPRIADILRRASETGSLVNAGAQIPLADFLLHPDVTDFRLLRWSGLDDFTEIGYRHAGEQLATWAEAGRALPWR